METASLESDFNKCAAALMRIRDGQLYRETYESYDAYLKSIPMTRRQADQIVRTYKIQQSLLSFLSKARAPSVSWG